MSFFGDVRRVTRTGFDRVISARERQARRYVNSALLNLDDETPIRLTSAAWRHTSNGAAGEPRHPECRAPRG